jgi:DNA-binding phage protein
MGFEGLAISVEKPAKSIHRMLSSAGNPTMTNLAAIFSALKSTMKVDIQARCVSVA